jgi:hypothetical protein
MAEIKVFSTIAGLCQFQPFSDWQLRANNGHSTYLSRTTALPKIADGREKQFLSNLSLENGY